MTFLHLRVCDYCRMISWTFITAIITVDIWGIFLLKKEKMSWGKFYLKIYIILKKISIDELLKTFLIWVHCPALKHIVTCTRLGRHILEKIILSQIMKKVFTGQCLNMQKHNHVFEYQYCYENQQAVAVVGRFASLRVFQVFIWIHCWYTDTLGSNA